MWVDGGGGQAGDGSVGSGGIVVFVVGLVSTNYPFLHAWECGAVTRNVLERLAIKAVLNVCLI